MSDAIALSPLQARERLFDDILTLEEVRGARFMPGAVDPVALRQTTVRAETLLRALAVIDDGAPGLEDPEQHPDPALLRMEAKLDALTLLVAGLTATQDGSDAPTWLRWSARGAEMEAATPICAGAIGRFRLTASEWLPTPLVLPATVIAAESANGPAGGNVTRIMLRFEPLSQSLESALERHVFRTHRRAVAESRRR